MRIFTLIALIAACFLGSAEEAKPAETREHALKHARGLQLNILGMQAKGINADRFIAREKELKAQWKFTDDEVNEGLAEIAARNLLDEKKRKEDAAKAKFAPAAK
jgi:hypothetical protein